MGAFKGIAVGSVVGIPELPTRTGVTWRPPTETDADAVAALNRRMHTVEPLDYVGGSDHFRWILDQGTIDPGTDLRVAVDDSGAVIAFGGSWPHLTDDGARCFLWADVDPDAHDLQDGLIAWVLARGREQLTGRSDGSTGMLRFGTEAERTRVRAAIEAAGFSDFRSFATMERPVTDPPTAPTLPEGVRVVRWSPEYDASTCDAYNEAFADHWGSLPRTLEMWCDSVTGSEQFRPDLSYLAVAGDRVVAFCICEVDHDHNESLGVAEVYIELVGTVREHRGHGLASHLIVCAIKGAATAGLDVATLTVDEMSHTNATEVYRRLGFTVRNRTADYYLEV